MNGLIGQTLGGYRITAQIGKGGMASVFKAYQPSLERYVAIKVMPAYYAEQDESFLKRFQREAKAIASLRHPNILIVLDYGEQDGITYIVMEYVESGTLTDLMGRPLPADRMATLIEQVAAALDYAHQSGVVHRDIKPSNILLPKPDWPLLTDFGLAKIVGGSQLTQSGTIAGTPAYMSPEQGRGDQIDARSDIYSLGIVLYEMATGAVPFQAETPMAVVVKHIIDPLPLPRTRNPDLPEGIERVILKALAKEPDDRYQQAGQLAAALNEAAADLRTAPAPTADAPEQAVATTLVDEAEVLVEEEPAASRGASAPSQAVAEEAAAQPPAGVPVEERRKAGSPISRRPLIGGLVVLAALAAFGAWRLLGAAPEPEGRIDAPVEQEGEFASFEPAEGRTTDQLIGDAQAKYEAGDFEAALVDLEAARDRDPQAVDQWVQISQLYLAMGDMDNAVGTIEAARSLDPQDAWAHEAAGYVYQELGDHRTAAEAFERALELDPGGLWIYLGLAESRLALGEPEAAEEAIQRALQAGAEQDPDLLDSIGWLYLDHGDPGQAEAIFGLLTERYPGDLRGPYGMAEIRYQAGDVAGAIEALEPAAEAAPEASAYETLAWWYWELGQLEQAQRAFERAIELDPQNGYRYVELARALAASGDGDEALRMLQRGAELAAGDPWLYQALGWGYAELARCDLALDYFEQALELEPGMESARDGVRECGG